MKIAIIGCGWVGRRLAKYLSERNHYVIATTTSPEKSADLKQVASEVHLLDFSQEYDESFLKEVDFAIFSMPISRDSWFKGFQNLKTEFPKTILFSSTGIYPQKAGIYNENHEENLRTDILEAENIVRTKYPQTVVLRFGGLMGDERSPQHFFRNKEIPNKEKRVNYIHHEDISAIVELLFTATPQNKVYNIVAPEHPTLGEILNLKKEDNTGLPKENGDRIISSDLFIQEFIYTFIQPNPKYF